uniref:Uncharacterized protein n=1 Tax=Moniliophthora roreri TaxID=221103 RepID=A0A0W0G0R4_MONRR
MTSTNPMPVQNPWLCGRII